MNHTEINFEHKGVPCIVSYSRRLLEKQPHEYVKVLTEEILTCVGIVENKAQQEYERDITQLKLENLRLMEGNKKHINVVLDLQDELFKEREKNNSASSG